MWHACEMDRGVVPRNDPFPGRSVMDSRRARPPHFQGDLARPFSLTGAAYSNDRSAGFVVEAGMELLLELLSLSDRYERRARLLPGLIAATPMMLTIAAVSLGQTPWYTAVGLSAGAELVLAFVLAYLARATGKATEETMWAEWGGPPTTRWLRPSDTTCSEQQKSRWRGVIKRITNLTIPASVTPQRDVAEIDRIINDAVRQLRYKLRDRPEASMVRIHNEEYGQVRNLCGLRWYWVGIAALSLVGCLVLLYLGESAWAGFAVAAASLVLALILAFLAPGMVRRCANRYAESLFAAAVAFDEKADSPTYTPAQPAASPAAPSN